MSLDNVSLLLKIGASTVSDASNNAHPLTLVGHAAVTSAIKDPFGQNTVALDGNGDRIDSPSDAVFGFGAGDYTLEGWFNPSVSQTGSKFLLDLRVAAGNSCMVWASWTSGSNRLVWSAQDASLLTAGGAWTVGSMNHWAVTRSGTTVRGFIGGALVFTTTDSRTYASPQGCYIGSSTTANQGVIGNIGECRITKGVALYTAAFTPPTAPFPTTFPLYYGTVRDKTGALAVGRGVRVIREHDQECVGAVVSDAIGEYAFAASVHRYGSVTTASDSTITDSTKAWTVNEFATHFGVRMTSGTQAGEWRRIVSNTATALTLASALPGTTAINDTFEIVALHTLVFSGESDRNALVYSGVMPDEYTSGA